MYQNWLKLSSLSLRFYGYRTLRGPAKTAGGEREAGRYATSFLLPPCHYKGRRYFESQEALSLHCTAEIRKQNHQENELGTKTPHSSYVEVQPTVTEALLVLCQLKR